MEAEYLLNAASFFLLSGIVMHTYAWMRKNKPRALNKELILLAIACALPGIVYLLWAVRFINPLSGDALLMMSLFYALLSSMILLLMYRVTGNPRIPFMFFLYLISLIGLFQTFERFQFFMLAVSNLLLIIIFLDSAISSKRYFRMASIFGIIQSGAALAIAFLAEDFAVQWWFIPNIIAAGFFLLAYIDREKYQGIKTGIAKPLVVPFQMLFVKYILYVFALVGFMLVSTVAIHESGHGVAAKLFGCSYAKIILYDFASSPHTELLCGTDYSPFIISIAGLIFTTMVAAIFWFTEPKFSHIAGLMFSIGLLISYRDFKDIGLSETLLVTLQIISVVLVVVAIARVAVDYLYSSGIMEKAEKEEHISRHRAAQ